MLRRGLPNLIVLGGYTAISFAYFGWRLLPHPGRVVIGTGHDPEVVIWSFAWWPHAIGSLTNPFSTSVLYAPDGVNLAWTASAPGLALAFAPVTVLFGPVAAYNAAALLLPALSAWTAYLLCRYLTGSIWAAVVGGYLFGFSTAFLRQQLLGHLHVTAVFLLPLIALVLVKYVKGALSRRGLAWRLGVLLGLQLWISSEFALTLTLFLAVGLLIALWAFRDLRPRLRSSLAPVAAAYAIGAVVAAPIVVYTLIGLGGGSESFVDVRGSGTDLLNFLIPTRTIGIGGSWFTSLHFRPAGASAYLGLPTLLIIGVFAVRARRTAGARFLVAMFAIAVLVTLGTTLEVDGHDVVALPWSVAAHVPALNNVFPFRVAVYVSLAAAVIVAVWTGTTKGWFFPRPYVLPVLAVAALVPAVWRTSSPTFHPSHPERVAFFSEGLDEKCLARDETLAMFPFGIGGDSLLWQAEAGFRFRLAEDGLLNQPEDAERLPLSSFYADPTVTDLNWSDLGRPTMDRLLAFAATHHVDRIVSTPSGGYPSRAQMERFGRTQLVGGVLVSPACGEPSLRTRDLSAFVAKADEERRSGKTIGYCLGPDYYALPLGLTPGLLIEGATPAKFVEGQGLGCSVPDGYEHRGFATPEQGVPANTYPLYAP